MDQFTPPPASQPSPWWRGRRGEWYVAAQGALLVLVLAGPQIAAQRDIQLLAFNAVAAVSGGIAIAAGVLLAIAGAVALGRNLTPLPHPVDSATLVESGAYRLVRHPIYSGICSAAIGWALWCNSAITLACALLLFIFFDIKSRREERWLTERFPGYAEYRTRVRKLFPFVY